MSEPAFNKTVIGEVVNDAPPGAMNTFSAAGDIDGDGLPDFVLCGRNGRMVWLQNAGADRPWPQHLVDVVDRMECGGSLCDLNGSGRLDFLLDAHSLQLGDICGQGHLDVLVGEVGMADPASDEYIVRPPRLIVFENDGRASFTRHVIDEGTGTHKAVLVDTGGHGATDIAGKSLHGPEKWQVHVWYNIQKGYALTQA